MKRVVVIDDSEIVLEAVKGALEELDCEVLALTEPTREAVADHPPDLVLVDVNMPQAFGDDIALFFREAWGITAPIYLYSSLPAEELAARAEQAGAEGYICKSWGIERLVEEVQRHLGLDGSWRPERPTVEISMDPRQVMASSGARAPAAVPPPAGAPAAVPPPVGAAPAGPRAAAAAPAEPAPPAATDARGIFERYARRCDRRRDHIARLVEDAEGDGLDEALDQVDHALHDWIGEAKLLGFDKLSAAVSDLKEVVGFWRPSFARSLHGRRLVRWVEQLAGVAQRLSLEAPASEVAQQLQGVRGELEAELGGCEFEGSRTPLTMEPAPAPANRRILVFDDSPIVGEVLSMELETRGHRVALADDLAAFERRLVDFEPEVIFLDINMPEIKGDALCRQLRGRTTTESVPIIFLSSLGEGELAELARKARADGYLSKQKGVDELVRYLDDLLSQVIF